MSVSAAVVGSVSVSVSVSVSRSAVDREAVGSGSALTVADGNVSRVMVAEEEEAVAEPEDNTVEQPWQGPGFKPVMCLAVVVASQVEHIETVTVGVASEETVLEVYTNGSEDASTCNTIKERRLTRVIVIEFVPLGVPNSQTQHGWLGVELAQMERVRTSYVAVEVVVTSIQWLVCTVVN